MVSLRALLTLLIAIVLLSVVQAIVPSMAAQASPRTVVQMADGGLIKPSKMFTLETGADGYVRSPAGVLTVTAEYTGVGTPLVMTYTDELSQTIEYTITQSLITVPERVYFYSDAADVGDYGDVQFQVSADVSDTILPSLYIPAADCVPPTTAKCPFYRPPLDLNGLFTRPQILTAAVVITWTPQFSNAPLSGTCATATEWADAQTIHVYDWPVWSQIPGVAWDEPVIFYGKTSGTQSLGFEVTTRGQCVRLRYEVDTADRTFFPRVWARAINRK